MDYGSIFYRHNVVGGVVNLIDDIYGARTHSASRYNAYTRIYNFSNKKSPVLFGDFFIFGFYHIPGFVGSFS